MKLKTLALAAMMTVALAAQAATGPSTTISPNVLPTGAGVEFTSILTVGDLNADNGYKMVGIPDGLGVINAGPNFIVLLNHEISSGGNVRGHGAAGAFVSQWTIRKSDLKVLDGQDFITDPANMFTWDPVSSQWVAGPTTISRLCSADLAPLGAYFNPVTKKGTFARIFLNGEESGAEGRSFAWVKAYGKNPNQAFQLPYLGRASWENWVTNPVKQDKTIVVGTDDNSSQGQVYVYIGEKQSTGNAVERAGLQGGKLFAVKVNGNQTEDRSDTPFGVSDNSFGLVDVSDAALGTGAALNTATVAAGASSFLRPEDAAWDPLRPNVLFVATTDRFDPVNGDRARVWELSFTDITQPELGGTIRVAGDGNNGFKMGDNLTVDRAGHVILQEDVGNNARLGKIWDLKPSTGALVELGAHDPARFITGAPEFLTQDEESSGVVEITTLLGGLKPTYDIVQNRYYLIADQVHKVLGGELVEGGQLLLMKVPKKLVR